jgi:hypothetical protein
MPDTMPQNADRAVGNRCMNTYDEAKDAHDTAYIRGQALHQALMAMIETGDLGPGYKAVESLYQQAVAARGAAGAWICVYLKAMSVHDADDATAVPVDAMLAARRAATAGPVAA